MESEIYRARAVEVPSNTFLGRIPSLSTVERRMSHRRAMDQVCGMLPSKQEQTSKIRLWSLEDHSFVGKSTIQWLVVATHGRKNSV
jgi:hypothetical protein